jgi:CRP-like cAMP-binding protein
MARNLNTTGNRLLDGLGTDDLARLLPHLVDVKLSSRQTVNRRTELIEFTYFPTRGMVSMVATLDDGSQVEVGVVGSEGMVGSSVLMGSETASNEAFVQIAGSALRLRSNILVDQANESRGLRERLLLFTQTLVFQISQTGACNASHSVEERLSRWLLLAHDRVDRDDIPLTQEFLAIMLGVRRAGVTVAAGTLQKAGLIRYSYGSITVLDRPALEEASCGCYRLTRNEYTRLLG